MSEHYILVDRKAVPCDLLTWAKAFKGNRHVAQDVFGDVRVSTVFLGLNHAFGNGPPLIFETMIFGGPLDQEQERCTTWEQAEQQHAQMLARAKEAERRDD